MTAAGVKITKNNVDDVILKLNARLSEGFLYGMLATSHAYLKGRSVNMFKTETGPDGSKWAPLAESTVSWRESLGYGGEHPINRRIGFMEASVTRAKPDIFGTSDHMEMHFPSATAPQGQLAIEYAQAAGRMKGPARPFVGMTQKDVAWILTLMETSIFRKLK